MTRSSYRAFPRFRQRAEHARSYRRGLCLAAATALVLAGCGGGPQLPSLSSLNPFKSEEVKLPGKRVAVLTNEGTNTDQIAAATGPLALPAPAVNAQWSQPGGTPTNAPGHLQLNQSLKSLWRASAGRGSSSSGKLTASPIVYSGRVYTLDAYGTVAAFSASSGKQAWRFSLAPKHENAEEGFGGGLAADDGQIYVGTGYGTAVALDARSGRKIWDVDLGAPVRNSPTAAGGKVFVATIDGRFHALSAIDGRLSWRLEGAPQAASIITNVSPAVGENVVVLPTLTGEVIAVNSQTGESLWTDTLTRARTRSSFAAIGTPGRPAISGGTVFAVGNAGQMIASNAASGERLWTKKVRSLQMPWVVGDTVFVVSVGGRLMALDRTTGAIQWATNLPKEGRWSGPVLAGGRLWLASSKGKLARVDATSGRVLGTTDLGDPVFVAPVVADGKMFVLTDTARLIALR
ncbi:MAG: PQQ-binding-like beta-propeller repeat protein [Pseudomonadota bacterium]